MRNSVNRNQFPYVCFIHTRDIVQAKEWCKQNVPDHYADQILWEWDCTHDINVEINNKATAVHEFGFQDQEKYTWFKMIFEVT